MTTPNIEELMALADRYATLRIGEGTANARKELHDAMQSQAERIKELEPNIQNKIVKDISEKPCKTCVHYQQGKLPGVSIYDETCYICREYYANKWEAKSE